MHTNAHRSFAHRMHTDFLFETLVLQGAVCDPCRTSTSPPMDCIAPHLKRPISMASQIMILFLHMRFLFCFFPPFLRPDQVNPRLRPLLKVTQPSQPTLRWSFGPITSVFPILLVCSPEWDLPLKRSGIPVHSWWKSFRSSNPLPQAHRFTQSLPSSLWTTPWQPTSPLPTPSCSRTPQTPSSTGTWCGPPRT